MLLVGKEVTIRELRLGLFLTAGSESLFTSVVISPPAPSSLNTAYVTIEQPPASAGGNHEIEI